jgi:hypothetical protein
MPITETSTDQRPIQDQPGDGDGVVLPARRARQGFKDRPILWVMLISITLVVIAFGFTFLTNNDQQAAVDRGAARTGDPAAAQTFDMPAPAPVVVESD